jgi:hypothetical protein
MTDDDDDSLGLLRRRVEDGANRLVKDLLEALLSQRRALHVLDGRDLLLLRHALLVADGGEVLLAEARDGLRVLAQIELGADEQERRVGAVVRHLGKPLGRHVLKRRRRDDGEADEEDVGLRVRERAQAVVVLLASRVPQAQVDRLAVDHHVCRIVVEHSRNVLARERIGSY